LGVLLVCAGVITLLVIIYQGYLPRLVRARSQEELEVVFAGAQCDTDLTGASCETQCVTGLTGRCHQSDWWTLAAQVLGDEKLKLVVTPNQPPLCDIKVLSIGIGALIRA
jgi:hypothetical protein